MSNYIRFARDALITLHTVGSLCEVNGFVQIPYMCFTHITCTSETLSFSMLYCALEHAIRTCYNIPLSGRDSSKTPAIPRPLGSLLLHVSLNGSGIAYVSASASFQYRLLSHATELSSYSAF